LVIQELRAVLRAHPAESLGFAETLRWLRSFDDPERIRLCLRVEI
jgi:hypothetical protein